MRRRVDNMFVVGQEVAAGGHAFPGRHHVDVGAVGVHDVLLVALAGIARGLKHDPFPVGRPIRFRVLSAVRQLLQSGEVLRAQQHRQVEGRDNQFHTRIVD